MSLYNLELKGSAALLTETFSAGQVGRLLTCSSCIARLSSVRWKIKRAIFRCGVCGGLARNIGWSLGFVAPLVCINESCTNRVIWNMDLQRAGLCVWRVARVFEFSSVIWKFTLPRLSDVVLMDPSDLSIFGGQAALLTGYSHVVIDSLRSRFLQNRRRARFVRRQGAGLKGMFQMRSGRLGDFLYRFEFRCNYVQIGACLV